MGQNQALKRNSERKAMRHTGSVNSARLIMQELDVFSRSVVVGSVLPKPEMGIQFFHKIVPINIYSNSKYSE